MATRRFCDRCDNRLKPEDDQTIIRSLPIFSRETADTPAPAPIMKIMASISIFNEHGHAIPDLCNKCKMETITKGEVVEQPAPIATLQHPTARLYKPGPLPTKPPIPPKAPPMVLDEPAEVEAAPAATFEPSMQQPSAAPQTPAT